MMEAPWCIGCEQTQVAYGDRCPNCGRDEDAELTRIEHDARQQRIATMKTPKPKPKPSPKSDRPPPAPRDDNAEARRKRLEDQVI